MLSFKEFITEARSRGEAMEEVIIAAVNGSPKTISGISKEAGVKVAKYLKSQGIKGKGVVLGADQVEVTDKWASFWPGNVPGSTKTPKTDFKIGKAKISLKTGSAAQLMSGGRNESIATFNTALTRTRKNIAPEILEKLDKMFDGLAPASVASTNLRDELVKGKNRIIKKANAAHKLMMSELSELFSTNPAFANAFAFEAMSGKVKFGGNDGTCTHFLVTDFDGNNAKLKEVSDRRYVASVANQMKLSVRFKTTSVKKKVEGVTVKTGQYRYWSVVGLIVDKLTEEYDELERNGMLTEGMLTGLLNKAKQWLKVVLERIKKLIASRTERLFEFLEIQPIVSFNNKIKW